LLQCVTEVIWSLPAQFASMCLDDGQQMLLALAWTSNKARCLGSLNSEVLAVDVTKQTNCEKWPLTVLAGLTSNGRHQRDQL
jgi:hypothetical protein